MASHTFITLASDLLWLWAALLAVALSLLIIARSRSRNDQKLYERAKYLPVSQEAISWALSQIHEESARQRAIEALTAVRIYYGEKNVRMGHLVWAIQVARGVREMRPLPQAYMLQSDNPGTRAPLV